MMSNLHVLLTVCTVRLITLVLLSEQTTARYAIFLLFTHCLSPKLIFIVLVETYSTPKCSIAQLARDSNMGKRARRNWHTITARLFALMCHVNTTSFITCFTHIPFSHLACYIYDHMVMTCYVIIKEINSFFSLDLSIEHYVFTIQGRIYNSIVFKIFLEWSEICDTSTSPL